MKLALVFNWIARFSVAAFVIGFSLLWIAFEIQLPIVKSHERRLAITSLVLVVLSPLFLIMAIVARDLLQGTWRFTTKSFLILTTLLAIALALSLHIAGR